MKDEEKGYIKSTLSNRYFLATSGLGGIDEAKEYTYSEYEDYDKYGFLSIEFVPLSGLKETLEHLLENDFKTITSSIADLLEYKDLKYGEAALKPLGIFTGKTKVGNRLDDKLSRVKNNKKLQKNDVADIIGYLILVCKENGWNDFSEFKD